MQQNRSSIPQPAPGAPGELPPRLLSAFVLSCLVAGCGGGSAQLPNPTAQTLIGNAGNTDRGTSPTYTTPRHVASDSSHREVLIGTAEVTCHEGSSYSASAFHAHGKATGRHPGTFIASGNWEWDFSSVGTHVTFSWGFNESFTITSGSSKFPGKADAGGNNFPPPKAFMEPCRKIKNYIVPHTSSSKRADIKIISRGKFRETLYWL